MKKWKQPDSFGNKVLSDFCLFPHLKEHPEGQNFHMFMEPKKAVGAQLQKLCIQWFNEGFEKLFLYYSNCIDMAVDYVEK